MSNPASNYFDMPPNLMDVIKKKYDLDGGRMERSIELLEEWIAKQQHFLRKDFDREYLERVLIACKGSVEKTKTQIDQLCTLKTLLPKFFDFGSLSCYFDELMKSGSMAALPKLTKDYKRVIIGKTYKNKFSTDIYLNYFQYCLIMAEFSRYYDYSDGFIIIQDLRCLNMAHLLKTLNLIDVQQLLTIFIKGYGAKVEGLHCISDSKLVHTFINMLKPLLDKKIADRIHSSQSIEDCYSFLDKDILPVEYGGKERPLKELSDQIFAIIRSTKFDEYLEKRKQMRTDESLRQPEKYNEDCMGLPGSFRNLYVD